MRISKKKMKAKNYWSVVHRVVEKTKRQMVIPSGKKTVFVCRKTFKKESDNDDYQIQTED